MNLSAPFSLALREDLTTPMVSPCVHICKLNAQQECIGCGRTLEEIARWQSYSDAEREQIMQRLRSYGPTVSNHSATDPTCDTASDQSEREEARPMRIVSLLPSATEIICALGLEENLVGVTHECDYPPSVKALPKVTRTLIPHDATSAEIDTLVRERLKTEKALYSLEMETLERLCPDLIVTQALCDVCAVAEAEVNAAACRLPGLPKVINLEPMSLEAVYETLLLVGEATCSQDKAQKTVQRMRERVAVVEARTAAIPLDARPRVAFLEWIEPPFHGGHWTPSLIAMAGGMDVLGRPGQPSHTLLWRQIVQAHPEVLFIACCGYNIERALQDFSLLEAQEGWNDLPCTRSGRVYFTDGSAYFNRPGPRLVDSLEILAHALHPDIHPLPEHLIVAVCPLAATV